MGSYIAICIVAAPFYILAVAGYWLLFKKAGRRGWEALIPYYADYIMLKLSGRPGWWVIWLFIPLGNLIVSVGIFIGFIKCFGKFTFRERAAGILLPFIYLPKWGADKNVQYLGPATTAEFKARYPESAHVSEPREWAGGILLSVLTAIFIRTFFIEAFVIPTPSMERTLLVGDHIFVSKLSYGARLPITPIAFPFANHTLPSFYVKAYWDGLQLPYFRLPGFSHVKRGNVVVFNYPQDTINNRPVDKREFYIKRCEGIAGDTFSVIDGQVYVNGKQSANPQEQEMEYQYTLRGAAINPQVLKDLNVVTYDGHEFAAMTKVSAEKLKGNPNIKSLTPVLSPKGKSDPLSGPVFPSYFPMHAYLSSKLPDYKWSVDNYGPIIIPKKGWTVKLDSMTFPLYERAIEVYENNKVQVSGKDILINGQKTDTYTFKMDYYWMMGDNRHDSEDSRYWGFLPEDHILGKAVFTWTSLDADAPLIRKIRWGRMFKAIN